MLTVDISNLNKAEILASLFNASRPLGMGFMQNHCEAMSVEEAEELLKKATSFDYVRGRVMKINLSGNELRTGLYNRDNGQDAAERVIAKLRQ